MSRILILGGYGFTGKSLARHLLERTEAQIVLAGRHRELGETYAGQLNTEFKGERVSAVRVDAADTESLRAALRGIDLLLVAAPTTRYADSVIRCALETGVDYLDVQLGAKKFTLLQSLAPDIQRAGRCFITEAGFHPGLPAAMVRYAAAQLDSLESALTAGYLNMGQAMPYSEAVDELMGVFQSYQAQVFKDGHWTKTGSFAQRRVNFGGEVGLRSCYSMFFEELRALPEMLPTLKEVGFYIAGSHWFVDWIITPLVMVGLKVAPRYTTRPLGKFLWWGMQNLPKPPYLVMLKVEASGKKDGKPARVEAAISHKDGYELTAIPVVACLEQYLDGSARRPGLWLMGQLVDPERLFRDVQQMGVQVTTTSE